MKTRLAGWRRVTQLGEICVVITVLAAFPALFWSCSAASFWQIQLLLLCCYSVCGPGDANNGYGGNSECLLV
jgi:hypothetical protein